MTREEFLSLSDVKKTAWIVDELEHVSVWIVPLKNINVEFWYENNSLETISIYFRDYYTLMDEQDFKNLIKFFKPLCDRYGYSVCAESDSNYKNFLGFRFFMYYD